MNDYLITIHKYNFFLEKAQNFFNEKFFSFSKKINSENNIDIFLKKILNNKWFDVINLSIFSIVFIHHYDSYNSYIKNVKLIMKKKNWDYNDAWIYMDFLSIKEVIVQKVLRIKNIKKKFRYKILSNYEKYKIYDNYLDILNYCIFLLIKKK